MESFRRRYFPTQDEIRANTAARLREEDGARLNAEEIARTYPPEARRAHEARVAANAAAAAAAAAAANSAYLNSRRAWEANEERKKREDEAEQAEENGKPRRNRANVERIAAALPNAGRPDSDFGKPLDKLETWPMVWDIYKKKLQNRIDYGLVSSASESEKSSAKNARYALRKFTPLIQKPRNIDNPFSEIEFIEARNKSKRESGDRYEYEQKLFAEPNGGPIRIDPEFPHYVFRELEDGTARYFESGYPKPEGIPDKKLYPYPVSALIREPVKHTISLKAGGSKKRSTRSKKNRSRKQK